MRHRNAPFVIERVEAWRREHKWSARRITDELAGLGHVINRRTVTRHLTRLGPGQRRFLDPNGDNNRRPAEGRVTYHWPGDHWEHTIVGFTPGARTVALGLSGDSNDH